MVATTGCGSNWRTRCAGWKNSPSQYDLAVITAQQVTREAAKAGTADLTQIAEAFAMAHSASVVIGYAQTQAEHDAQARPVAGREEPGFARPVRNRHHAKLRVRTVRPRQLPVLTTTYKKLRDQFVRK